MTRKLTLVLLVVVLLASQGCSLMTQAQKDWIADKANRSAAYTDLMDKGQTTSDQDKLWIKSQDESWQLWAKKTKNGFAAPSWLAGEK